MLGIYLKVKRALVSVWDKKGLEELAKFLSDREVEIISSGGTKRYLEEKGAPVRGVEEITGFPEMLSGRVKTLHPAIHGGILARKWLGEDLKEIDKLGIEPLDLVVVNLYPFEEAVLKGGREGLEALEFIDIGGPTLIRAAAKNYPSVVVLTSPEQYPEFMRVWEESGGDIPEEFSRRMAAEAFARTSAYDTHIYNWLWGQIGEGKLPPHLRLAMEMKMSLRYGENPYQKGAYYHDPTYWGVSLANSELSVGAKEISYNNILDIDAAISTLMEFPGETAAVVIKHTTPSGVAVADSLKEAFVQAYEADSMSAFGGIVGLSKKADLETAEEISKHFFEVVVAPDFDEEAFALLRKKKNLRIVKTGREITREGVGRFFVKSLGGALLQTEDVPSFDPSKWRVVTEKAPTEEQMRSLVFATKVCFHVKSNSIVLVKGTRTVGIGAGQMARVDAAMIARYKAGEDAKGSVMASDAFFPFRDGIDEAAKAGVVAIAQPGGSIRDQEVIDAANEHGIAMVFTGERLFRH